MRGPTASCPSPGPPGAARPRPLARKPGVAAALRWLCLFPAGGSSRVGEGGSRRVTVACGTLVEVTALRVSASPSLNGGDKPYSSGCSSLWLVDHTRVDHTRVAEALPVPLLHPLLSRGHGAWGWGRPASPGPGAAGWGCRGRTEQGSPGGFFGASGPLCRDRPEFVQVSVCVWGGKPSCGTCDPVSGRAWHPWASGPRC